MGSVRVAIVGVGNCASSLVQGVEYYKDADPASRVPGLMHVTFGPYHVSDVEFVAAFDVDAKKVGRDLAEAIGASENNTIKICDVPPTGLTVQRGPTMDGLGQYYHEMITESDDPPVDVVQALRDARADVLVSYLPVGSEQADRYYARCAWAGPAASRAARTEGGRTWAWGGGRSAMYRSAGSTGGGWGPPRPGRAYSPPGSGPPRPPWPAARGGGCCPGPATS